MTQVAHLGRRGFSLVQVRLKGATGEEAYRSLRPVARQCLEAGGWPRLIVNDHAEAASLLASEGLPPWGLHLGQGDLPASRAATLPGLAHLHFGASTHGPAEWRAVDGACDHAGVGPFRATATKGDHARPIGLQGLEEGCGLLRAQGISPIAIGGLGVEDADSCFRAGAESMAMVSALHRAPDPADLGWVLQRARWAARPILRRGRSVVLIGPSGAGKSTLGALLATGLGLPFHDLDEVIERRSGRPVEAIFREQGEAGFRRLEAEALPGLLEPPAIVALGGGAWEAIQNREAVARVGAQALWLAEPPEACWDRVAGDPVRPLAGDREVFLARCRQRMGAWSQAESVSSFGRPAPEVASALLSGVD